MHEMSIAQSIVDIVREEMDRHKVEKLRVINLVVGKLTAVVPSHLNLCFRILVDKTDLESTLLNIREVPLGYECSACGAWFETESVALTCIECGRDNPTLLQGRELAVENIEVGD